MGIGAKMQDVAGIRSRFLSPSDAYFYTAFYGYGLPRSIRKAPVEPNHSAQKPLKPLSPTVASPQSREHVIGKITELVPDFECNFIPVDGLLRSLGDEKNEDSAAGYVLTVKDESGNDIPPLKLKNAWWGAMKAVGLDPHLTSGISYDSIQCVGNELWINNSVIDALNRKRWEQKEGAKSHIERLACMKLGMEGCGNNDSLYVFAQALSQALGSEKERLR